MEMTDIFMRRKPFLPLLATLATVRWHVVHGVVPDQCKHKHEAHHTAQVNR
jgi:hypothetical protein